MTEDDAAEPDYVQAVRFEAAWARLAPLSLSPLPLPPATSPIVIGVIRNEAPRLPDFLRHYREGGIRRFCLIDNGSTDGTVELLAAQPDVDLLQRRGRFDWRLKQGWISRAIAAYGPGRWFLHADADEQIVFDGFPERGFPDLAEEMQARGQWRVRGFLLDMYPPGPVLRAPHRPGARLVESYPLHDGSGYAEKRVPELVSVKGGPRQRAFGAIDAKFNPELSKYPLFRLREGEWMASPHHIWPYGDNLDTPRHLAILHFKFLPDFTDRVRLALAEKNYWGNSIEYRCYHQAFGRRPELSLEAPLTARYGGPAALVDRGLIAPVGWSRPPGAAARLRAAAHRARAGLAATLAGAAP